MTLKYGLYEDFGSLMIQTYNATRRNHIRITPESGSPVRVNINNAGFINVLNVVDLSQGGFAVNVPRSCVGCNLEQLVSFTLDLPKPRRTLLHGLGKVKHISGDTYGIAFMTISHEVEEHLREYIEIQLKRDSWWSWLWYKLQVLNYGPIL